MGKNNNKINGQLCFLVCSLSYFCYYKSEACNLQAYLFTDNVAIQRMR